MLFIMGVCQWELLYEGLCVLSCTYKLSYVLCYLLWVCVSESICMKVCMSCPVYIVVRLILFHHGCVSVRESVWKFVCLVLYILSYVLCYFIMGVCQWEHTCDRLFVCVLSCIYIVGMLLFHYGCVSVRAYVWIRVITKLPNSEQFYKGTVKTHNYINRQNQSTTGKLWKP